VAGTSHGIETAAKLLIMNAVARGSQLTDMPKATAFLVLRWGFSGLVVTNLFAYRATQPRDLNALMTTSDGITLTIGVENNTHLEREASSAKMIVCAWGDNCDVLPHRDLDVIGSLQNPTATRESLELYCIRRTKKGNPAHPVREPYTDAPVVFYSKLN
jgi:hypothetical protein